MPWPLAAMAICALVFAPANPVAAATPLSTPVLGAASLRTSFGGGVVLTKMNALDSRARAITVQPDGKVVISGNFAMNYTEQCWMLIRFHTNGTLDTAFGAAGMAHLEAGDGVNWPYDVEVLSDGKILTAGMAEAGGARHFALAQVDADGKPDPSFGVNGTKISNRGVIHATAIQRDGKIVAAGYQSALAGDAAVERYLADGTLDPTFGVGGRVLYGGRTGFDRFNDVQIQPDGRIVLAGSLRLSTGYSWFVARLLPDGSFDPTFGVNGKVFPHLGDSPIEYDEAFGLDLQDDGKIVVSGNVWFGDGAGNDWVAVRFTAGGRFDHTFGANGIARITSPEEDRARTVDVLPDGALLVSGDRALSGKSTIAMAKLTSTGALDTSYGESGWVAVAATTATKDDAAVGRAATVDGDTLFVAGYLRVNDVPRFAVAAARTGP